jgi:aryl-alcohol dehydrogenase-like predicted oxidoreductase
LVKGVKNIIGKDKNLAQTAISFCLAYETVSTVIPGNTTIAQLKSNLESIANPIPKELVDKLEQFYENEVKMLNLPW